MLEFKQTASLKNGAFFFAIRVDGVSEMGLKSTSTTSINNKDAKDFLRGIGVDQDILDDVVREYFGFAEYVREGRGGLETERMDIGEFDYADGEVDMEQAIEEVLYSLSISDVLGVDGVRALLIEACNTEIMDKAKENWLYV